MDNTTFLQELLRDAVKQIFEIIKIAVQSFMDKLTFKKETKNGYVAYNIS